MAKDRPKPEKRLGHEKGRTWWATLRGPPSEKGLTRVQVDGDTAYYAWTEGARLMGVEPHRVKVEPILAADAGRGAPSPGHDPWSWLTGARKSKRKRKKGRKNKSGA